jgi:hypothetical protein
MNTFAAAALIGWIPIRIALFAVFAPRTATLISVLGCRHWCGGPRRTTGGRRASPARSPLRSRRGPSSVTACYNAMIHPAYILALGGVTSLAARVPALAGAGPRPLTVAARAHRPVHCRP